MTFLSNINFVVLNFFILSMTLKSKINNFSRVGLHEFMHSNLFSLISITCTNNLLEDKTVLPSNYFQISGNFESQVLNEIHI